MPRSNEMFYEVDGKRQDADLHAEMLDGLSPEAERRQMEEARASARAEGATEAQLDELLPLEPVQ